MYISNTLPSGVECDNSFDNSVQQASKSLQDQNFFFRSSARVAPPKSAVYRSVLEHAQIDARQLITRHDKTYGRALQAAHNTIDKVTTFKADGSLRNRQGNIVRPSHQVALEGKILPLVRNLYDRGEAAEGTYRNPKNKVTQAIAKITHAQQKLDKRADVENLTENDVRQIRKASTTLAKYAPVIENLQLISRR